MIRSVDVRAVSMSPEMAFAVAYLDKRIINKSYHMPSISVNQRVVIHAIRKREGVSGLIQMAADAGWHCRNEILSARRSIVRFKKDNRVVEMDTERLACGCFVAVATFLGSYEPIVREDLSPWARHGRKHWYIDDVSVIRSPVSYEKGKEGTWVIPGHEFRSLLLQCGSEMFRVGGKDEKAVVCQ